MHGLVDRDEDDVFLKNIDRALSSFTSKAEVGGVAFAKVRIEVGL
jgi:hypothetical protein